VGGRLRRPQNAWIVSLHGLPPLSGYAAPSAPPGRPLGFGDVQIEPATNQWGQPLGWVVEGWEPRPEPVAITMPGRHCRLEPFDVARHANDLYTAYSADDGRMWTYLPYGPFESADQYRDRMGRFASDASMAVFAIVDAASERAGGVAAYHRAAPEYGSVEVGHIALSPRLQRTVAATEAMALMMGYVFNVLGYRRYEWKCDALNLPSRRAAERLGFAYEGTFRRAVVVKGRNRDTAWFSVTDGDWQRLEPAFAAWLAPANFDALGRQRQALSDLTAEALTRTPSR
jgi:RimJ/RimL family protein N-acetyltransferase